MTEIPSNSEKPEKEKKQEKQEDASKMESQEEKTGLGEEFRKALRLEELKEREIKRLRRELIKQYPDLTEEQSETIFNTIFNSEEGQERIEKLVGHILEWEETRKRLYGPFDFKGMKDDFKNLIGKIIEFFKRKK